jgi:rubredoxin
MLPRTVLCDDCREKAYVRAYGRLEYDWGQDDPGGQFATEPVVKSVRLTIDCPRCGVKTQDFHPAANTQLTE